MRGKAERKAARSAEKADAAAAGDVMDTSAG